jgi:hypothetical protein
MRHFASGDKMHGNVEAGEQLPGRQAVHLVH